MNPFLKFRGLLLIAVALSLAACTRSSKVQVTSPSTLDDSSFETCSQSLIVQVTRTPADDSIADGAQVTWTLNASGGCSTGSYRVRYNDGTAMQSVDFQSSTQILITYSGSQTRNESFLVLGLDASGNYVSQKTASSETFVVGNGSSNNGDAGLTCSVQALNPVVAVVLDPFGIPVGGTPKATFTLSVSQAARVTGIHNFRQLYQAIDTIPTALEQKAHVIQVSLLSPGDDTFIFEVSTTTAKSYCSAPITLYTVGVPTPTATPVPLVAPTCTLTASQSAVAPGTATNLQLCVTGSVTTATVNPGGITGTASGCSTISVTPTEYSTYTATITGPAGNTTCSANVCTTIRAPASGAAPMGAGNYYSRVGSAPAGRTVKLDGTGSLHFCWGGNECNLSPQSGNSSYVWTSGNQPSGRGNPTKMPVNLVVPSGATTLWVSYWDYDSNYWDDNGGQWNLTLTDVCPTK